MVIPPFPAQPDGSEERTLEIERTARGWAVRSDDLRIEGRALTPLLENVLGTRHPEIMRLTMDALEGIDDLDAPLARDSDATHPPRR